MKVCFFVLLALMIPVYLFLGFYFTLSQTVISFGAGLGKIEAFIAAAGAYTPLIGLIGFVFAILFYRKKKVKRAFLCVFAGLIFGGLLFAGDAVLAVLHSHKVEQAANDRLQATYGENWDAPARIEGIPEQYEAVLSQFYVAVRDRWSLEQWQGSDLYAWDLTGYYGEDALAGLGFALIDLNGDGRGELLIGTVPVQGEATTILAGFTDPDNPFPVLYGMNGETYYLHRSEDGGYMIEEIGEYDDGSPRRAVLALHPGEPDDPFDYDVQETACDPAGRLTVEMTPFSAYK